MSTVERLQQDHGVLRIELDALDGVLGRRSPAAERLLELGSTLAMWLERHVTKERRVRAFVHDLCRQPLMMPGRLVSSHYYDLQCLHALNRQLMAGLWAPEFSVTAGELSRRLRRHLERQEAVWFPVVARVTGNEHAASVPSSPSPVWLSDGMTLQQILRLYPAARQVFDRWQISCDSEGAECLEYVAWRHGLESHELLLQLMEAIESRPDALTHTTPRSPSRLVFLGLSRSGTRTGAHEAYVAAVGWCQASSQASGCARWSAGPDAGCGHRGDCAVAA